MKVNYEENHNQIDILYERKEISTREWTGLKFAIMAISSYHAKCYEQARILAEGALKLIVFPSMQERKDVKLLPVFLKVINDLKNITPHKTA